MIDYLIYDVKKKFGLIWSCILKVMNFLIFMDFYRIFFIFLNFFELKGIKQSIKIMR